MTAEKVVGAKYALVKPEWIYNVGDVFTLIEDDGSSIPLFEDMDGGKFYLSMSQVVKLNMPVSAETSTPLHISAEQFAQLKQGDKFKLRKDLIYKGWGNEIWLTEMQELAQEGAVITVCEEHASDTIKGWAKGDYWYYTAEMIAEVLPRENESEFDCPELKYGNIYKDDDGWIFRYSKTNNTREGAEVTGTSHLCPDGEYYSGLSSWIHFYKWREATTEEAAKLEAAEKAHGYVPPLVNKLGTVIEAGKVYASDGHGVTRIFKVLSVGKTHFQKEISVTLPTGVVLPEHQLETHIDSQSGSTTVPATELQIMLYEAAIEKEEADKAFKTAFAEAAAA